MQFDRRDAEAIATKLKASLKTAKRHDIAVIYYGDKAICQFGIRRGSGSLGHNHIPGQIHVTNQQARDLVQCPMSYEQWIAVMKEKQYIIEEKVSPPRLEKRKT